MSTRAQTTLLQYLLARYLLVVVPGHEPAVDIHLPVDMSARILHTAGKVVEADLLAVVVRLEVCGVGVRRVGLVRGTRVKSLIARLVVATVIVVDSSKTFLAVIGWHILGGIENCAEALVWALVVGPLLELTTEADHWAPLFQFVERTWFADEVAGTDLRQELVVHLDVAPGPLRVFFVFLALLGLDWFWLARNAGALDRLISVDLIGSLSSRRWCS
jgi:hypothetical protein